MPAKTAKKAAPLSSMGSLRESMTKRYGAGQVTRREEVKPYEVIPTGSMDLDLALRVGGWVRGRIHEIVGQEGVGKTTLVINSMVEAQKKYPDEAVAIIDMEQTFDFSWAERQGLDTSDERFLHVYPDNSEDVSDQLTAMMNTGIFSLIAIDSIGGMESKVAFDKEAEERVMGNNAQVITRMVKRAATIARKNNVAVLAVNQYRANIANPKGMDQSAGPKAFKYSTTSKVEMRQAGGEDPLTYDFKDGEGSVVVGVRIAAKVTRNKVAAARKTGYFWIINQDTPEWGPVGIDQAQEAYTLGEYWEVFTQEPGNRYRFPWTKTDQDRIHGKKAVLAFLRANPDRVEEIKALALAKVAADITPQSQITFTEDGQEIDAETGEVLAG